MSFTEVISWSKTWQKVFFKESMDHFVYKFLYTLKFLNLLLGLNSIDLHAMQFDAILSSSQRFAVPAFFVP